MTPDDMSDGEGVVTGLLRLGADRDRLALALANILDFIGQPAPQSRFGITVQRGREALAQSEWRGVP